MTNTGYLFTSWLAQPVFLPNRATFSLFQSLGVFYLTRTIVNEAIQRFSV